jgi:molybdopterin synthase sulfur carrier subunit
MSVLIRIPTPLRSLAGGKEEVSVEGSSVAEAIEGLERNHAGFKARLYDGKGELRRFINLYVNQEDVRALSGLQTSLKPGDAISIIPAIAGG